MQLICFKVLDLASFFMESHGYEIIAYADDVAIILQDKYPKILCDPMENALTILSKWAKKCDLTRRSHFLAKTELVFFTRKHRMPDIVIPQLNGIKWKISDSAKYLALRIEKTKQPLHYSPARKL